MKKACPRAKRVHLKKVLPATETLTSFAPMFFNTCEHSDAVVQMCNGLNPMTKDNQLAEY